MKDKYLFTKYLGLLFLLIITQSTAWGAISQRGTATSATTANTTLTINKPTGVVAGDVMIVNITQTGNTATNASRSGWTLIDGARQGTAAPRYSTVLYRKADGTEGASFAFTLGNGTNSAVGSIIAFSGVDASVFDVAPGSLSIYTNNGTTATATGITSVTNNAAIVFLAGSGGTDSDVYSGWSGTSPTLTEIMDFSNSSVTNAVGAAWGILDTAGATGDKTVTLDANYYWAGILIALKPAIEPLSSQTLTFTSNGTFTVPSCVTSLTVEAWGGGGGGSTRTSSGRGGGGGGGAFASGTVTVIPGNSYNYVVGSGGGANTAGGNSTFDTNKVVAAGGSGGASNNTGAGAGGTVGNSIGNISRYAGGNGATGGGTYSGGGGGGAGTTGGGGNAPTAANGSYGAGTSEGGGDGGASASGNTNGNSGSTFGGGGSGAVRTSGTRTGGSGADGQIRITYTLPNIPTITLNSSTAAVDYSLSGQDATFAYTASTGCPDKYSIDFTSGIDDITDANLIGSPISIALPAGLAVGTYTGTLTVSNSEYGFVSNGTPITVTVAQPTTPTTITDTYSSSGTFIVPSCVTNLTVEAWGGGGGGSTITSNGRRGGGGGGGAFARSIVPVVPGLSYNYTVGSGGGANTAGGNTTFNTTTVVAAGGSGGDNNSTTAGAGGTVGNSTGDSRYAGGNGATGGGTFSGGGGGAAGTTGPGGDAPTAANGSYGTGTSVGGGNGGASVSGSSNGNSGATFGGGGSGASTNNNTDRTGGAGANGQIRITYTLPAAPTITLTNTSVTTDYSASAQNVTFAYSATTDCPDTYSINIGPTPFITDANLTTSPITITLPAALAVGTYNATLTLKNSTNGFVSQGYSISVIVKTPSPTIIVSPTSLTAFTYAEGNGPSQILSFTVQGTTLNSNINLYPTASFDISRTAGGGFTAESPLILNAVGGAVASTNIYVRMKAGFPQGAISPEFIEATAISADTVKVSASGTVTTKALLTVGTIPTDFTYQFGKGPSDPQSFTLSGTNLQGDVIITAPSDFQVSTSNNSGFSSAITLPGGGGTWNLTSRPIYVRLKENLGVGTRTQDVQVSSLSAVTKTVSATGIVTSIPTILNPVSLMGAFLYQQGSGPSGAQSFPVSGYNLTAGIIITAPTDYQVSLSSNSGFANSLTLAQSGGVVNSTLIYVRLRSGLSAHILPIESVILTSAGATTKSIGLRGVVSPLTTPTIELSNTFLNGFGYQAAQGGPSPVQSFVVSGAALTSNIVLTAPTNYEISVNEGSGFGSTYTVVRTGDKVDPTTIYMRLIAGKPAGDYKNVSLTATSAGATQKNISITGKVFTSPLIQAGGGGGHCIGTPINLTSTDPDGSIQNRYWEGPNSYYSTVKDPTIPNAQISNSGDYKVTANVVIGGNLITNGDFELGNTSFGSAYEYPPLPLTTSSLQPEGRYAVVDLPSEVHNNFSPTAPDHTPAPGTKQMVINGNTTPGAVVWSQTVNVVENSDFEFTYWLQTVVNGNDANPSKLQLYVNGIAAGPVYTANPTTGVWTQFVYNTQSGTNNILNLELINQNIVAGGNDFSLDDIVFQQILTATSTVNVQVNNTLPVSVSIAASAANPITQGATVTYTATPVNGGSTPAYQWKVNGVNKGTNSSTYSYIPANGDVIECVLTSSLQCVTGNPAPSNQLTVVFKSTTNYWKGSTDEDWAKGTNWTAGTVPLAGDDVIFDPAAVNNLVLDNDKTIGNLINQTTFSTVINAGKSLVVNQKITGSDVNPDKLVLEASRDNVPNGSLVVLSGCGTTVMATVQLYAKGTNKHPYDWTDNIEGSPTFGTQFTGNYSWQFFGVPVASVVAEPTFYAGFLREYNESINATGSYYNKWTPLNNSSVLSAFKGYEVTQDDSTIYTIKGKLMLCDQTITLTRTATTVAGSTDPNPENSRYGLGQNVISNSFTAAIPINQLTFPAGVEEVVYLYNTGSFGAWTAGSAGTQVAAAGSYRAIPKNTAGAVYKQIPSMQGFLLRHIGANGTNITMTLPYASLAKNDKPQTAPAAPLSYLEMELKGSSTVDQLWLFSQEGTSGAYDNGWDGRKFFGRSAAYLYALTQAGNMQVNTTDNLVGTRIAFVPDGSEDYEIAVRKSNLEDYTSLYLADLLTGVVTELKDELTSYRFTSSGKTGVSEQRFRIVDSTDPSTWKDIVKLNAYTDGQTLYVSNFSEAAGRLCLYDMGGRKVMEQQISAFSDRAIPVNLESGVYILQLLAGENQFSTKCIIR